MTNPQVFIYLTNDGHTGDFLGFGSLLTDAIVVLHPPAVQKVVLTEAGKRVPVRCEFRSWGGPDTVTNGQLELRKSGLPGPPVGILLDRRWPHPFTEIIPNAGGWVADEVAQANALWTALKVLAKSDPKVLPSGGSDDEPPVQVPIKKPWYCMFISNGPGCSG